MYSSGGTEVQNPYVGRGGRSVTGVHGSITGIQSKTSNRGMEKRVLTPESFRKAGGNEASGLLAIPQQNHAPEDNLFIMYHYFVYKQQQAAFKAS